MMKTQKDEIDESIKLSTQEAGKEVRRRQENKSEELEEKNGKIKSKAIILIIKRQ